MNQPISLSIVDTERELNSAFEVLKELRPHITLASFHSTYEMARVRDEYTLMGAFRNHEMVGLMGYRILFDYVHGKHLYIDDLVTIEKCRGQGIGATLLKEAELIAKKLGCTGLRLCTGIENEGGKKFYERENWEFRSVVYKKPV
jgi:ribosomal protein S18 acetylase RimI-like enzyme